jgi:protein O-GlcNAc transferase
MSTEIYHQALSLYRENQLTAAEELCRAALRATPGHADSLHLLGLICLRSGLPERAAELIRASLTHNASQPLALCNLGIAQLQLERLQDALASFEEALRLAPDTVLAVYNRANVLQAFDRHEEAILGYDRALSLHPTFFEALNNRGNSLLALGRSAEALDGFERALALRPGDIQALGNCRIALQALQKRTQTTPRLWDVSAEHDASAGRDAGELHRLGLDAARSGDTLQAVEWLEAAVAADPRQAAAHCNLGAALLDLKRPGEALLCFERALQLAPGYTLALYNHGTALFQLRRFEEALVSLEGVLRVEPHHVNALVNHGSALRELQRNETALLSLARALELAPDFKYVPGAVAYLRLQQCDWTDCEARRAKIREGVLKGQAVDVPFSFLSLSDRPAEQRRCAQVFVGERSAEQPTNAALGGGAGHEGWRHDREHNGGQDHGGVHHGGQHYGSQHYGSQHGGEHHEREHHAGGRHEHERIRLAYVSGDFREHAVSYLMVGVLEQHDRSRFEVIGVSLRAEDSSPMAARIRRACDRFLTLSEISDEQIGQQIRELQADIVVDLVGLTEGVRPGILASRPAPIQVNYLGYPGTLGAPYIDYLLADEFVIPAGQREHYSEQVVYLPECFQANDDRRPIEHSLTRVQCNLPESALVLCCFNNTFKLSPPFFDVWLRLLQQLPNSVLWLLADRPIVQQNLCAYAAARGISAQRLVFAPRLPYAQHLGRLALADLFLDTLPFNAGTTASDALWAGLPVLTCAGEAFAARMAGSLLTALGLPELITYSLPEYEQRALELTADPERLTALRQRLTQQRTRAPLFDTARFTRHLESAYSNMYRTHQRRLPPHSFHVPALD